MSAKVNNAPIPYEIRRDGETVCASSLPMCGYPAKILKDMLACGYRYYVAGKMERKPTT